MRQVITQMGCLIPCGQSSDSFSSGKLRQMAIHTGVAQALKLETAVHLPALAQTLGMMAPGSCSDENLTSQFCY